MKEGYVLPLEYYKNNVKFDSFFAFEYNTKLKIKIHLFLCEILIN